MGFWLKHLAKLHKNGECPLSLCMGSKHKQKKVADREMKLINIAHELVDEIGFANLTMDQLVKQSGYSKGTIYKHFSSKEDLITALGIRALTLVIELSNKALKFPGHSREVALASHFAYQLYSQLEPTLFMCVLSAKTPTVMEKSSPERLNTLREKEQEITSLCDQLFQAGIEDGSLYADKKTGVEGLTFANWAMSFGTNVLLMNAKESECIDRLNQKDLLLNNINLLFDGMGWQPLSSNYDYGKTNKNLAKFFSDYLDLLNT